MKAKILVSIVTHNSGQHLRSCLDSLQAQTRKDFSVFIWDNASTDETSSIIAEYRAFLDSVQYSNRNLGFSAAHNRLIASDSGEYALVLNPDVFLDARYLEILTSEMDADPVAGSATGKLLRWEKNIGNPVIQGTGLKILDSTGIYMTPNQRHFDRGSGEIDRGQYDQPEYVFGASGAAAFYRRTMLEDIRNGAGYFDESFFAYREDADLAWRAQWMGWRCLYVPEARGYHVRRVLPYKRAALPAAINMHSFKNRFLLRIKNMDLGTYARFFFPITLRDAAAFVYVLVSEWSSLRGIILLLEAFPRAWKARKFIAAQRRVSAPEIRSWFSYRPVAKPRSAHLPVHLNAPDDA
jgi:GT2 family glycosyltransferase